MPPKRKSTGKTKNTTPTKAPLAAIQTSSTAKRRNGLQGAKTSSRFPSEALHMTTRRAAKTASNHSTSGAPSIASSSSRRSSLNDLAHFDDANSDIEDERPAKRTRVSTDSGSPRASLGASFADQIAVNGIQRPNSEKPESRSTSNDSKASSKKRRASDESLHSSNSVSARPNGVFTRNQSDLSDLQPRRKKRRTTQIPAESADQPPELTDASTAPNSPEQLVEFESNQNLHHVLPTNGDAPAKLGRRLPGRRRAPHADINVEIDLRRQLNLKMSYRSIAKIQKNILEELSNRTTSNLEKDSNFHKQSSEYELLMAALDQHKRSRLAQVHALRTEKLAQLDRVSVATERMEKDKYIQRFKDLQEDLLLQCFYRMKQIDREMKGREELATDDEDNVIAATHVDFPTLADDDRLGSKFASRSRAYVETERLLDEELLRKRFDQGRKYFVANNEDADDSIVEIPGGFASFSGPDRTEAVAHWNVISLLDAATDIESTPPQLLPPEIIPNEQADALFLLASLSAEAPRGNFDVKQPLYEDAAPQTGMDDTPIELHRVSSPAELVLPGPSDQVLDPKGSPGKGIYVQDVARLSPAQRGTSQARPIKERDQPKNENPVRSTHRIMDILNNDTDVPFAKFREPQPPTYDQTPAAAHPRRPSTNVDPTLARNGPSGLDAIVHRQEYPSRILTSAPSSTLPTSIDVTSMSPSTIRYGPDWAPRRSNYMKGMSEETLRRKDPLNAIRAMLDAKAMSEGRLPPSQRSDHPESIRKAAADRDRALMAAPPPARPFSPSGMPEKPDANRPSNGVYNASPSAPPLSYNQSPGTTPAYLARRGSQDPNISDWGRDRRMSGSQLPPYVGSPSQPYPIEPHKTGSSQAARQSPYLTPSAPHLPSISQSLPPKPPGPPPSGTINYRFAHYDPVPPRQTYPSPQTVYPPITHPPPQPQYMPSYNGPPSYPGYVPPPGSFQAPPPPLPPPSSLSQSQYPPLKIHQYGGQPILPANMAPPPHSQPPPTAFVAQQPPLSSQSAYSPPSQHATTHSRTPSYDQQAAGTREGAAGSSDRTAEGGSRQRRQYRSYHAPGTQFRSYQGPDSGRRRGG